MKKLLILLLFPVISAAQTKKPIKYYYDSLGVKHNWDSMVNVVIKQTIDSMKVKGYIKEK
jgi:hypothetical protein